jgi:pimeloyl-ACP methyl ester carboxylesterase
VRKLVLAASGYTSEGMYPEVAATMEHITPELFDNTPVRAAFDRAAPDPEGFPALVEKIRQAATAPYDWSADSVRALAAPTMIVIGDSDGTRPEHAVELFRLRGGGVFGDIAGLPAAQLAILPGTTHVGVLDRWEWLLAMIPPFLDAPMPEPV